MRLGELLMLRAQLQKDVEEHASRVSSNAVREVGTLTLRRTIRWKL